MTTAIQQRVIDRINKEIGSDFTNLHKSRQLIENYKKIFTDTKAKVLFSTKQNKTNITFSSTFQLCLQDDNIQSDIKSALRASDTISFAIEIQVSKVDEFQSKLSNSLQEYENVLDAVSDPVAKVSQLEHLVEYFRVLDDISNIRYFVGLISEWLKIKHDFR